MRCIRKLGIFSIALIVFFLPGLSFPIFAGEESGKSQLSLDFDQILSVRLGISLPVEDSLELRFSFGASPFGITTMTYSGTACRRLMSGESKFQLNTEVGVLLGYFNFFEGEYVDWDPIIDDPFHGFIPGAALVWGYRGKTGQYSLITGVGPWWEWQRDSGWKGPRIMPVVGLRYAFR